MTAGGPRSAEELAAALRGHLARMERKPRCNPSVRDGRWIRHRFSLATAGVLREGPYLVWVRYYH